MMTTDNKTTAVEALRKKREAEVAAYNVCEYEILGPSFMRARRETALEIARIDRELKAFGVKFPHLPER